MAETVNVSEGGGEAETGKVLRLAESLKKKTWLYKHFIDALVSGTWRDLPQEEIARLVEEKFFSFEPLTPLTEDQEDILKRYAMENLTNKANAGRLRPLLGEVYLSDYDWGPFKMLFGSGPGQKPKEPSRRLSVADKLNLFSDPDFFVRARYTDEHGGGGDLKGYGNRNITEYAYSRELMERLIAERGKAVVLDIGSGMGLALDDLKKEYGDKVETHGFSAEEEPAMFPADYQHYGLAERMPKEFAGKFDLIFSNMAFRYFVFQNIALGNVVRALRVGGTAELHFGYGSGPGSGWGDPVSGKKVYGDYFLKETGQEHHYEAMKILVAREIERLQDLTVRGLIDRETNLDFDRQNAGVLIITKLKEFDYT